MPARGDVTLKVVIEGDALDFQTAVRKAKEAIRSLTNEQRRASQVERTHLKARKDLTTALRDSERVMGRVRRTSQGLRVQTDATRRATERTRDKVVESNKALRDYAREQKRLQDALKRTAIDERTLAAQADKTKRAIEGETKAAAAAAAAIKGKGDRSKNAAASQKVLEEEAEATARAMAEEAAAAEAAAAGLENKGKESMSAAAKQRILSSSAEDAAESLDHEGRALNRTAAALVRKGFASSIAAAKQQLVEAQALRVSRALDEEHHKLQRVIFSYTRLRRVLIVAGIALASFVVAPAAAGLMDLAAGVNAVVGSLAPLAGNLVHVGGLLGSLVQGFTAAGIAFRGVGKALTAQGTAFENAMEKLTPAARDFVNLLRNEYGPAWRELQRQVQQPVFEGAVKGLTKARPILDVFTKIMHETGHVIGDTFERLGRLMGTKGFLRDFGAIGNAQARVLRRMSDAALSLFNAFRHVMVVAAPFTELLAKGLAEGANNLENLAEKTRADGSMAEFFRLVSLRTTQWWLVTKNVAGVFIAFMRAAQPLSNEFLGWLIRATGKLNTFLNSAKGQNALKKWMEDSKPGLIAVGRLIGAMAVALYRLSVVGREGFVRVIDTLRTGVLPAIEDLATFLAQSVLPHVLALIDAFSRLLRQTLIPGFKAWAPLLGAVADGLRGILNFINLIGRKVPDAAKLPVALIIGGTVLSGWRTLLAIINQIIAKGTATNLGRIISGGGLYAPGRGRAPGGGGGGGGGVPPVVPVAPPRRLPLPRGAGAIGGAFSGAAFAAPLIFEQIRNYERHGLGRGLAKNMKQVADVMKGFQVTRPLATGMGALAKGMDKATGEARILGRVTGTVLPAGLRKLTNNLSPAELGAKGVENAIRDLRENGAFSIADLRRKVAFNMRLIKSNMGKHSAEAKLALSKNFDAAVDTVKTLMAAGVITVDRGMNEIQRLTVAQLKNFGLSEKAARKLLKDTGGKTPVTFAAGKAGLQLSAGASKVGAAKGFYSIGSPGQGGQDTVPVNMMVGKGEIVGVFNRHQQKVLDHGARAAGYRGGLPEMFSKVDRPNWMASGGMFAPGGIVPIDWQGSYGSTPFPGREGVNRAVYDQVKADANQFRAFITDAYGPGHDSPEHTQLGTAVDYIPGRGGSWGLINKLAAYGVKTGKTPAYYDGRFGTTALSGHGEGNHLHLTYHPGGAIASAASAAISGLVGGAGMVWDAIGKPKFKNNLGVLTDLAAQGLGVAVDRANAVGESIAGSVGSGGGGGSQAANKALGHRMMLAFGFGENQWPALLELWMRESGWDHLIRNQSSGAYGIPQSLPASKMASAGADYLTNPATQIRWGLGYIKGKYGTPSGALAFHDRNNWYSMGGLRQFLFRGGYAKNPTRALASVYGGSRGDDNGLADHGNYRLGGAHAPWPFAVMGGTRGKIQRHDKLLISRGRYSVVGAAEDHGDPNVHADIDLWRRLAQALHVSTTNFKGYVTVQRTDLPLGIPTGDAATGDKKKGTLPNYFGNPNTRLGRRRQKYRAGRHRSLTRPFGYPVDDTIDNLLDNWTEKTSTIENRYGVLGSLHSATEEFPMVTLSDADAEVLNKPLRAQGVKDPDVLWQSGDSYPNALGGTFNRYFNSKGEAIGGEFLRGAKDRLVEIMGPDKGRKLPGIGMSLVGDWMNGELPNRQALHFALLFKRQAVQTVEKQMKRAKDERRTRQRQIRRYMTVLLKRARRIQGQLDRMKRKRLSRNLTNAELDSDYSEQISEVDQQIREEQAEQNSLPKSMRDNKTLNALRERRAKLVTRRGRLSSRIPGAKEAIQRADLAEELKEVKGELSFFGGNQDRIGTGNYYGKLSRQIRQAEGFRERAHKVSTGIATEEIPQVRDIEIPALQKELGDLNKILSGTMAAVKPREPGQGAAETSAADELLKEQLAQTRQALAVSEAQGAVFENFAPLLYGRMVGRFDHGALRVPETGMALVHRDETIIPDPAGAFYNRASRNDATPQVTVYIEGDAAPLMRKVRAEVDGRAARVVSERLGRRSRLIAGGPGR